MSGRGPGLPSDRRQAAGGRAAARPALREPQDPLVRALIVCIRQAHARQRAGDSR